MPTFATRVRNRVAFLSSQIYIYLDQIQIRCQYFECFFTTLSVMESI